MEDLKRIFKFMKPCRREFFLAVMFVIIEASFELTIPMLMADMIDVGVADRDMDYIVARGLTMMACALLALVTGLLYARFSARAANGFGAALREAEYRKVQEYSFENLDHFETSSLITRMTADVTVMQNTISGGLRPLTRSPIMLLMGLGMTFYMNKKLVSVCGLHSCAGLYPVPHRQPRGSHVRQAPEGHGPGQCRGAGEFKRSPGSEGLCAGRI